MGHRHLAALRNSNFSLNKEDVFCDKIDPVRYLPSKHGAMCGSDNVWKVISNHPDLAKNKFATIF